MPTIQIGSGPTKVPPKSNPIWDIWGQILNAFSGAHGFFAKFGVIFNALYALVMASIRWSVNNIAKAGLILAAFVAVISLVVFIYQNQHLTLSAWIVIVGMAMKRCIQYLKNKQTVTVFGMAIARSTCILCIVAIATVFLVIGFGIYYLSWKTIGFIGIGFVALIILIWRGFTAYNKNNSLTKIRNWLWQPASFMAVGIAVLNGLFWAIAPETWENIWNDQVRFWVINLGAWVALILLLIPEKDEDGKDQSAKRGIARNLAMIILVGVVLTLIVISWRANVSNLKERLASDQPSIHSKTTTNSSHSAPAEVALRLIAECESGGKQFEEDGKTPLKNNGIPSKGIKPSSAFGKYQFLEMHREPAKKLGFDLDTEEGQDSYAKHLYAESGTKHWEFDEQYGGGKACWEPKLRAWTWGGEMVSIVVKAPIDGWSDVIPNPYAPRHAEFEGFGKKYKVLWNGEEEEDFPQGKEVKKTGKIIYNFRFKSTETEPVNIVVKFF